MRDDCWGSPLVVCFEGFKRAFTEMSGYVVSRVCSKNGKQTKEDTETPFMSSKQSVFCPLFLKTLHCETNIISSWREKNII